MLLSSTILYSSVVCVSGPGALWVFNYLMHCLSSSIVMGVVLYVGGYLLNVL